ncbi:MAG: amidohydrolase family protein [Chloroflexota bacterium]
MITIRCGRLIDGTGAEPTRERWITIDEGRIAGIASSPPPGTTDDVLDASDQTVMPGMMDLHVHLIHGVTDPREPHILYGLLNSSSQLLTLWAARNARLMLEAGFTTIRDVGSFYNPRNPEVLGLRDGIRLGLLTGPRIVTGGWVSQTAGHRDMFPPSNYPRDPEWMSDGPWAVRRMVRTMVRDGVDFIKTSTSGGAGSHGEEIWWRNWTTEELEALVDEAHAVGKRVASHSHSADSVKRALRAGVDTIEHGIYLDDEAVELLLRTRAALVPTLSARSERAIEHRRKSGSPPEVLRKFDAIRASGFDSFRRAHEAGVLIAMGTDTGRGLREYFGKNAYELTQMVQAGMTPMDAVVAATRNAAIALGQAETLGTLEIGKQADLIVVDGDPLTTISVLEDQTKIRLVMVGGEVAVDRGAALTGRVPAQSRTT